MLQDTCAPDEDSEGLTCYPACKPNWIGKGSKCHQMCPKGYETDTVGYCQKPMGYFRNSDHLNCTADEERIGLMCYPKCREGYQSA